MRGDRDRSSTSIKSVAVKNPRRICNLLIWSLNDGGELSGQSVNGGMVTTFRKVLLPLFSTSTGIRGTLMKREGLNSFRSFSWSITKYIHNTLTYQFESLSHCFVRRKVWLVFHNNDIGFWGYILSKLKFKYFCDQISFVNQLVCIVWSSMYLRKSFKNNILRNGKLGRYHLICY